MADRRSPERSDAGDARISRRRLLAGLTTVGALGSVGGAGTAALLSNTERVGVRQRAGAVDLALCWEEPAGTPCVPRRATDPATVDLGTLRSVGDGGRALLRVALPDDGFNDPALVWMRTNCPDDGCGLERKVVASVSYVRNCDPESPVGPVDPGASGSLCEVLRTLAAGVALDGAGAPGGDREPLVPQAASDLCLVVEWTLVEPLCEPDAAEVTFEFYAEQARHNRSRGSPWPDPGCNVDCDTDDCPDCPEPDPDPKGISWVAFSTDAGVLTAEDVDFGVADRNGGGEPVSLRWSLDPTAPTVRRVALKTGDGIRNFPGGRSGTATSGSDLGSDPLPGQTDASPWPAGEVGVKFDYVVAGDGSGQWTTDDATLVRADPPTPGAASTHTASVTVDADRRGPKLVVEYPPGVDPSGATLDAVRLDGKPLPDGRAGTDFAVSGEAVTVALDAFVEAGDRIAVTYSDVTNPGAPGSYPVEIAVDGGPATEGRLPIE
jgi:hypothetical protein